MSNRMRNLSTNLKWAVGSVVLVAAVSAVPGISTAQFGGGSSPMNMPGGFGGPGAYGMPNSYGMPGQSGM